MSNEERNELNFYTHLEDARRSLKAAVESLSHLESIHVLDVQSRGDSAAEMAVEKLREQVTKYEIEAGENFLVNEKITAYNEQLKDELKKMADKVKELSQHVCKDDIVIVEEELSFFQKVMRWLSGHGSN